MANKKSGQPENEQKNINNYTMSVTCRLTGIESHRIRRYEAGGLINPVRSKGNQRLFSEQDISIIIQIARLEDEGVNLEGIRVIMEMRRGDRE